MLCGVVHCGVACLLIVAATFYFVPMATTYHHPGCSLITVFLVEREYTARVRETVAICRLVT